MAEVMVTREMLERLDRKLQVFTWQLSDDERDLLQCLVALGSQQAARNASEVSGAGEVGLFGGPTTDAFAPLSDMLRGDTTIFVPPPPTAKKAK